MKTLSANCLLFILGFLFSVTGVDAKNKWPKEISVKGGGKIIIYQPQPEELTNNILKTRAAIAIRKSEKAEPIFGVIWADATIETDRESRMATLKNIIIR